MKKISSLILLVFITFTTIGCASLNTGHSIVYSYLDNQNVDLLFWSYAGDHNETNKEGLGKISRGMTRIDKEWVIRWRDKKNNKITTRSLPIENLPINMKNAIIRLIFNRHNEPELYVIYKGPTPYASIEFEGSTYAEANVRKIYPKKKEINFLKTN